MNTYIYTIDINKVKYLLEDTDHKDTSIDRLNILIEDLDYSDDFNERLNMLVRDFIIDSLESDQL